MPSKNKKGKNSKLARMNDEERARYLQHRAEMELEAKRRKEQLILMFTKNKLKREEAFARINTAKLNEQWRAVLRRIKCTSQKGHVEFLRENFEKVVDAKDNFIQTLYNELKVVGNDHRRFQEAHAMILDDITEIGRKELIHMYNNYEYIVKLITVKDLEELQHTKVKLKERLMYVKTVMFAKEKNLEEEITEIRTQHAISIQTILYDTNEAMLNLKRRECQKIEVLWQQLNEIITNYEGTTENKRKQYEYLKRQDDAYRAEAKDFPKIYTKAKETAEILSKNIISLSQKRKETVADLTMQSELLTKRVSKLRAETKTSQTTDAMQLKRLSVISNKIIKDLQRILDKSVEFGTISKLCSDAELDSLTVKKFSIKNSEGTKKLIRCQDKPFSCLKKIEGFRDDLFSIKEENAALKKEHNNLLEENNGLKHRLRNYLVTVSRMPTICPIVQI